MSGRAGAGDTTSLGFFWQQLPAAVVPTIIGISALGALISQMKKLIAQSLLRVAFLAAFWLCLGHAWATDLGPKPTRYFNDYASLIDSRTAQQLDQRLEDFERQTSNQILVVIYKSLPPDASVEDFTQDAFRAWKVGQAGRNNGAVLFVFVKDRKMRIQTGYGLEGALPDAICKRIISDEMAPRFQAGDFAGGMTAAVNAMIAATRGEYKGTGQTVAQSRAGARKGEGSAMDLIIFVVVLGVIGMSWIRAARRGIVYSSSGSRGSGGAWWIGGGGGGGGYSGGGGGGGFSGGGGDSGGGGASGGW
jgi:uncharacterized protein